MDLSRLLTDRHEVAHKFGVGSSMKTYMREFFLPTLKFVGEKKLNISPTFHRHVVNRKRVTSKRLNILTKTKTRFFSYDKRAKTERSLGTKLGASPHGVLVQLREKIDKL